MVKNNTTLKCYSEVLQVNSIFNFHVCKPVFRLYTYMLDHECMHASMNACVNAQMLDHYPCIATCIATCKRRKAGRGLGTRLTHAHSITHSMCHLCKNRLFHTAVIGRICIHIETHLVCAQAFSSSDE